MKITVCQMRDDRAGFEADWAGLAKHVASEGSDVVLLPEMPFSAWFCAEPRFDAEVWNEVVGAHRSWAANIPALGAGTVLWTAPEDLGGRRVNQGVVWTKEGGTRSVHLKNYLPNEEGFRESTWFQSGDRAFEPFSGAGMSIGFLVCSELWAMSRAREYGKTGVDVIATPRTTSSGSVEKWIAGGRTASVVSGAFGASSNRSGKRGGLEFGGCGWVFGPDGEVLGLTS